ncbi:General transcription factor 3C polypeptide [Corchorus olitorius]|uniref:General transcription factor 3C polypeptide n=1 Tax=Corchorus olitorius TaxID=93759 RepID=A0A1R3I4M0_9ROSI|nr:General transcription factor 3C polypeptide [Corchorus olitorius]
MFEVKVVVFMTGNGYDSGLDKLENDIDARLDLAALLVEDAKEDEAISLLSSPVNLVINKLFSDQCFKDRLKASRARKLLQKKAALKEEKKAAAIAAGLDWQSDEENDESEQEPVKEPPLQNLLRDEEHQCLIIDLCKALASLQRYYEALEIIKLTLKSGYNILPVEKEEELRSLGARDKSSSGWDQSPEDTASGKLLEALYNIGRACHHAGLVTLAASYYAKVLASSEKDYPIPKLPNENWDVVENQNHGYCDLRREAAFNLHLIYKKSGALDLARQVLRDHCTFE